MPINQVQFQRGLSMAEFIAAYGTQEKCEAALTASRWPAGFVCPNCGGAARSSFRREGRLYWQCANCPHQCSVTSGTTERVNDFATPGDVNLVCGRRVY